MCVCVCVRLGALSLCRDFVQLSANSLVVGRTHNQKDLYFWGPGYRACTKIHMKIHSRYHKPWQVLKLIPIRMNSTWSGLVAGTDGSVEKRTEVMGAGHVLGADPQQITSFFARVGGPLASARAEVVSLLQLLRDVWQQQPISSADIR
jgi:hypothetical protein